MGGVSVESEAATGFDLFTGLSRGGTSGSSGQRFKDKQCRKYQDSLGISASGEVEERVIKRGKVKSCKRWVVITTINKPTATIESLEKIEDWCMVLVFDRKTPDAAFNETKSERVVGVLYFHT